MNADSSEEKRINCEGGFGIMPHRLRKAENISSSAKLLFCALVELQHEKGYCYASNRYLAMEELNGVSTRSIQLWLSELERDGWIKIIITRNEENEVVERKIYTNLNQNTPHENFMTPREKFFMTPPEKNFAIKRKSNEKEIKENLKRNTDLMKNNPASGSPSSPDGDELSENISSIKPKKVKKLKDYEKDELFLSIWKPLPEYMRGCGPVKAYKMWLKATEKSTKNVEEIKKAITFYLKTLPEWQHPQHFSTFLNQGTWEEFCARAIEREQRQEQQPTQTENQKYWEDHENTQVIASKKVEQPKNLQLNINIARKLGLLDKFLPDEYNNEWKFLPKEIKEILTSEAVEKAVKQIKDKEENLINQIACVTMLGREGYCNWHDKCEEETGERPLEDVEWYIPFGKKLPSGFWTWLVKYSHNFGLPSNSQVERVRKWFYTTPRSPFHILVEQM